MLAVGAVATFASSAGYIGARCSSRHDVKRASLVLLLATALALALSVVFRGDRYLAAVYPIIGLAILQRLLLHHTDLASPRLRGASTPP